jgi:hypothetical protein
MRLSPDQMIFWQHGFIKLNWTNHIAGLKCICLERRGHWSPELLASPQGFENAGDVLKSSLA